MCESDNRRAGEDARMLSVNYDTQGRRVNPQGGYYMIPADQFVTVVARMKVDPRVLNGFRFVPLPSPAPLCPPAAPRGSVPLRSPFSRRR